MRRRIEENYTPSSFQIYYETPLIIGRSTFLTFMLHMFWNLHNSIDLIHVPWRNCGRYFELVESAHANFHFLKERNRHNKFGFWRNVADFDVENVLAVRVNSSYHSLSALGLGFLLQLLGLLFLLNRPLDLDIIELHLELINRRLGINRQRVINLQKATDGILISLLQSDIGQTIDDLNVVIDRSKWYNSFAKLNPDSFRPSDIATTFFHTLFPNKLGLFC